MRGNTIGKLYSISTFGESHGPALGVLIDGMPSKIKIKTDDLQTWLDRRRPGRLEVSTSRNESDKFEVLSGIYQDNTLGTPICIIVRNKNQKSEDYDKLKSEVRPGHADQTTLDKFGIRDHRGGGRASGRETLARVIGGYFANLIIPKIKASAHIIQIGNLKFQKQNNGSKFGLIDKNADSEVEQILLDAKKSGESFGGRVKLQIQNVPSGLGEPVFDKLKAQLSQAMLSIGSCVAIEFGIGSDFAHLSGKNISKDRANFGGIEGGISNGDDIVVTLTFKAPSTVGEKALQGRHDPCILPRVLVVVESMAYIIIADHYLRQNSYKEWL